MIFELSDDPYLLPDPHLGCSDGLIAVGGDLSVERLVCAYSCGFFPWYGYKMEPEIRWWCPLDRFVIFPKEIHVSHSMRQILRKGNIKVSFDQQFDAVIEQCAQVKQRDEDLGSWLGPDMIQAYKELHRRGYAMSVEVWSTASEPELIGGLYGVVIGKNFFGESMFSLAPNASKIALIALAQRMESSGGIIDCQFETPHLLSMGGRHIHYDEYCNFLPFSNIWKYQK